MTLTPSRTRSLVGLLLALPLAALIAGIFACLPVPIGDPETSKVDPNLVGGWLYSSDESGTLYIVRAYDPRTYLIQSLEFQTNADKSIKPGRAMSMKAWLTTIGDKQFLTADLFNSAETLGFEAPGDKKIYFVAAISIKDDQVEMRTVSDNDLRDIKTSAEAEKFIKANINNPKLYDEKPVTIKKVSKLQSDAVKPILEAFHME